MMNLYIKLENGAPVEHPYLEDNLKTAWEVNEITSAILSEKGFARFENRTADSTTELVSVDGYELCEDGIVRTKITVRELTQEEKLNRWVRAPRDHYLFKSDWTQMPDAPLTAEKKAAWATYRQALRDMTATYADIQDPSEIIPPVEPTK